MEIITSGTPVGAAKAKAAGLIDAIVDEADLRGGAVAFAKQVVADGATLRRVRDLDALVAPARGKPEIFTDFATSERPQVRGFEAPAECIRGHQGGRRSAL